MTDLVKQTLSHPVEKTIERLLKLDVVRERKLDTDDLWAILQTLEPDDILPGNKIVSTQEETPQITGDLALELSIEHWQKVVADPIGTPTGVDHCNLCGVFYMYDCRGCPVSAATGNRHCEGTPYDRYIDVLEAWEWSKNDADYEKVLRIAQEELDFLIGLRKKD